MNTYYFPINSSSLAHYFGGACIKAAKYFNNKPQDIQDRYSEFLLLTEKKGTNATDCCLELVLTKEEINDLINVKNGWYLFDTKPLPITRIKKIYFSDKEQMDNTITNIRMSTAFVPDSLLEICSFKENPISIEVPSDCQVIDQIDKIEQYDRFLGALALMRLAHEPYMNYSQNYIATLSFFNQIINRQINTNNRLSFSDAYQGIFTNSKGFERVLCYLKHPIDEESLNNVAKENNQVIKKDKISRKIDVDSLTDTWTYTIAILNAYGVGDESRKMRVDGLIQSNFNLLKDGKQEGVALCYGYNRGYSAFTKSYGDVAFKYKLESQLDYYTIESVYQYVFNEKVPSDLYFLDSWCPKLHPKQSKRSNEYMILDELVVAKKKARVFSQDWWNGFYQKFEKPFGLLSKHILEILKPFIENDLYVDVKEELQESFQEELEKNKKSENSLRVELEVAKEKLNELKEIIQKLEMELDKAKSINARQNRESQMQAPIVAESTPVYSLDTGLDEDLKKAAVKYKDSTLGELKKSIKAKDTTKLRDLLLSQPADLFSK